MRLAVHHYHKRKKASHQLSGSQRGLNSFVDRMVYVLGTLGVLIFVPQLIVVWTQKDISGVSVMSWFGMCAASTLWLIYGVVHREKPIMFANTLALVVQGLIILGILVH